MKQLSGTEDALDNDVTVLCAGEDVLDYYQAAWERLHLGGETAARQADRCDRLVSQLHAEYEKQWRHVSLLSSLLAKVPEMNNQAENWLKINLTITGSYCTMKHAFRHPHYIFSIFFKKL